MDIIKLLTTLISALDGAIAKVVDKLKVGSPTVYAIISLILIAIAAGVAHPIFADLVGPEWADKVAALVSTIVLAFVNSRSSRFVNKTEEKDK